jgi:hypothetical protein
MAPTNSNTHVPPIYNVPDLKKVEDNENYLAIYEIILATKAHIPVRKQKMDSFFLIFGIF